MGNIRLRTRIPGPRSKRLLTRQRQAVSHGIAANIPIFVSHAEGVLLHDVDGNTLIDFSGGIGATNSGHGNPRIVQAVQRQAKKFFHTSFGTIQYEGYVRVCEMLNRMVPIPGRKKSALFNSGAEAVENAVKIARKYTGRNAVVSFEEGFHGRTLLTLSLTGKVKPYKFGFGPFAPECYKLHYPYVQRRPKQMNEEEYVDYLLEYVENDFFKGVVAPENIACIVIELVAGEGGFLVAPKRYVQGLARLCQEKGILLVVDEVQSGFGRTGKMFATEHYGIRPDLVTMAKSLSNGMPLSAVTGRARVMDSVQEGGLGGTFSGHPLSCAAAIEAMEFIQKKKLAKRAERIGKIVLTRFREWEERYAHVAYARGLGAMCAFEIVKDKRGYAPDEGRTDAITKKAYENGLVVLSAGLLGNDIRTLMPLTISDVQLNEGLDVLEKAVKG